MLKTLFISNLVPWPLDNGAKMRIYHMLRAVAAESEVTLVCFTPNAGEQIPPQVAGLVHEIHTVSRETCSYAVEAALSPVRRRTRELQRLFTDPTPQIVRSWRSPDAHKLSLRLRRRRFDVVWGEHLGSVNLVSKFDTTRRVIDLFDLEHCKLRHWLTQTIVSASTPVQYVEYLKLRRFELALKAKYEVLVCSATDRSALGSHANVRVVPNGIDMPSLDVARTPVPQDSTFLFVGTLDYAPNVDAIQLFCGQILPRIRRKLPAAKCVIVGRSPAESVLKLHDGETVTVIRDVPEVAPYLRTSTALVVPIRFGGGTRIKILEGMAYGIPVISSTVGAEGIEVTPGRNILIADDPDTFAASCINIAGNQALRHTLSESGRELVEREYQWSSIESGVRTLLRNGKHTC
jgi:glycosyltransferase involved in cell wall biosynthesis